MFTDREMQVLRLRQQGLTQQEVAARLKVTQAAVSGFERSAKRKLADAEQTIKTAEDLDVITLLSGERERAGH